MPIIQKIKNKLSFLNNETIKEICRKHTELWGPQERESSLQIQEKEDKIFLDFIDKYVRDMNASNK